MILAIVLATVVRFYQSTYLFNESDGSIQLEVILSIPVSTDTVINVEHHNITAFSKFIQFIAPMV